MTDYKHSLNLPATDFPMRANLAQREPKMLAKWQSEDLYAQIRAARAGRPKYLLHDGPPYANGEIHLGHSVNKVLKDIIVKAKTLSGYDVPYVPGWDCHGLPIEHQVEKKVGRAGHKVSPRAFRDACRAYATKQIERQSQDFQRLGVVADWAQPYLTMAPAFEADIIRTLGRIIANGHLHKGFKPVHWCLDCASALAEAEVEYQDKSSPAVDVRFAATEPELLADRFEPDGAGGGSGPVSVVIWTTTPWTLPANQAVALHPEVDYVLIAVDGDQHGPERLVLAEALVEPVLQRAGIAHHRVLGHAKGRQLEGASLSHPFMDRQVPVVLGEHVTTEAGTGAVHTAPGHGLEDHQVGLAYGLDIDNPVDERGRFRADVPEFGGLPVFGANPKIVERLSASGALLAHETLQHSYPHCWRHKSPLIFRATAQWFISMTQAGLLDAAEAAIEAVQFEPSWGRARMQGMLTQRPDWCISRQRAWGVPIPLFVDRETDALHPRTPELLEAVAALVEADGIDAWFELEPEVLLDEADAERYRKVTDTLDVWFDSGASFAAVMQRREGLGLPADLYLEGSDQHRGWFQSSLLTAIAATGAAPYRTLLTHGFTVDANGRKMSKSLGNVVAPQSVWNSLGADVLRLWIASTDYRGEISVSEEILKRAADSYRRIRNTARFLLANLSGFDPESDALSLQELVVLDRWVLCRATALQGELVAAYDAFAFHHIYQRLHNFCVNELGGFYLDIIKDRQYTAGAHSHARRSAQTALHHLAEMLVRWLAPILSFTAEEIWQSLPGPREDSVFLAEWHQPDAPHLPADMDMAYWSKMVQVREAVNKELERQRAAGVLGGSLEAEVVLAVAPELHSELARLGDELRFLLITSSAELVSLEEQPDRGVASELAGLRIEVTASPHEKCERCWHRRADVGASSAHPHICSRCVDNIETAGEVRRYA